MREESALGRAVGSVRSGKGSRGVGTLKVLGIVLDIDFERSTTHSVFSFIVTGVNVLSLVHVEGSGHGSSDLHSGLAVLSNHKSPPRGQLHASAVIVVLGTMGNVGSAVKGVSFDEGSILSN